MATPVGGVLQCRKTIIRFDASVMVVHWHYVRLVWMVQVMVVVVVGVGVVH